MIRWAHYRDHRADPLGLLLNSSLANSIIAGAFGAVGCLESDVSAELE